METALCFTALGYLSGSVLFARLAVWLFGKPELLDKSPDGNPGTANAFTYGGFWCGLFVLVGDLCKGIVPVWCWAHSGVASPGPVWTALVLCAPVVGHAFPIFFRFQGGKGIAVTFGCLLGLVPHWRPALTLALLFIFFSLVVRIAPHFYRTAATYLCAIGSMVWNRVEPGVLLGFCLMTAMVLLRLHMSREVRGKPEVKLPWTR